MKIKELLTEINPLHLEDLKNEQHHSVFIMEERYKILIIRGLDISGEGLTYTSQGFIILNNQEIYLFNHEDDLLVKSDYAFSNIFELISPIYLKNDQIIKSYVNEIDKLEDILFERKSTRIFMDIWFELKKDSTRIERHLMRTLGILRRFTNECMKKEDFQFAEFTNLLEEISVLENGVKNQISRLDALYNYLVSIKNDKLNYNLFILTILSAIFLPLNLVVGFFGMNTENLFFKNNPLGTQYVLWIVLGSLSLSVFGLPLIRFVDNKIFRIFLGRYNIYKKISSKLDDLFKIE